MKLEDIGCDDKKIELLRIMHDAAQQRGERMDSVLFVCKDLEFIEYVVRAFSDEFEIQYGKMLELKGKLGDFFAEINGSFDYEIIIFKLSEKISYEYEVQLASIIENNQILATIGRGPTSRIIPMDLPQFIPILITDSIKNVPESIQNKFGLVIQWEQVPEKYYEYRVIEALEIAQLDLKMESIKYLESIHLTAPQLKRICRYMLCVKETEQNQPELDMLKKWVNQELIECQFE